MPPDERTAKVADRCATHPGRVQVATCELCGRSLCVGCAVPVRGVAYGPECLGDVLGEDAPVVLSPKPTRPAVDRATGVALAVALLATIAPWTRFGAGSGWFHGAWALDVRWSMGAAIPALAGIAVWWAAGVRRPALARGAALTCGALTAVGSLLAILNPPPFTKPALAPWIALSASIVAVVLAVRARRVSAGVGV